MFPLHPKSKQHIYLDHAAATPVDPKIRQCMRPYFSDYFANPSSLYSVGVKNREVIDKMRSEVAEILFSQPDTILFTSGGTESNNLAIFGLLFGLIKKDAKAKRHIITSKIEHDSVLGPIRELEQTYGVEVTYLDVDNKGFVTAEQVRKALKKETVLVSIMYANNELGTVEPLSDIGREILKWRKEKNTVFPYFHSDACQAANYLELSVEKLHVDLMTLNGAKIYGPKGTGVLFKRRSVTLSPLFFGGQQEKALRAGTENIPGIVGFTKALELAQKKKDELNQEIKQVRDYFWTKIKSEIVKVELNGPDVADLHRLPSNLNVSFSGVDAEALIIYLDSYGIFCSSGSACSTDSNEPSHVLKACGFADERSLSSIRFSLGKHTTRKDIDYVMKYLPIVVEEIRKVSTFK